MIVTQHPLETGEQLPFNRACHLFFIQHLSAMMLDLPTPFPDETRFFRRLHGLIQQRHRAIFQHQPSFSSQPVSVTLAPALHVLRTELVARFQPSIRHALSDLHQHQKRQLERQKNMAEDWTLDYCWSANTLINDTLHALHDHLSDVSLTLSTLELMGQHLLANLPLLYRSYSTQPSPPAPTAKQFHSLPASACPSELSTRRYPLSINARRFHMDIGAIGPTLPLSVLSHCLEKLARALRDTPLEADQLPSCSPADIMLLLEDELVRAVRTHHVRMLHPAHNDILCLVQQRISGLAQDPQLTAAGAAQMGRLLLPLIQLGLEDPQHLTSATATPRRLLHLLSRLAQADRCVLGHGCIEQHHLQRAATVLIATPTSDCLDTTAALSRALAVRYHTLLRTPSASPLSAPASAALLQPGKLQPMRSLVLLSLWGQHRHAALPVILHRFLNDYWLDVLTDCFHRYGPDTLELNAACTLTHDIINSLQPPSSQATRSSWLQRLTISMRQARTLALASGITNQVHQTAVHPLLEAHRDALNHARVRPVQPVVSLPQSPTPHLPQPAGWIELMISTRQSCQLYLHKTQGCLHHFIALDGQTGFAVSTTQLRELFAAGLAAHLDTRCAWDRQGDRQQHSP